MNFEKVELIGFKSFADRAEIRFNDGVTCIVGPNGCGKSNVADAIRWVMGEQSAKSLRGSNMQDFIFSGTQLRKPLSYCEVSLFFDNTNRIFPSLDYNEVIITRKLYRSGESEYYINKQRARLRDIVNYLREVGVGKEGYTVIGQGKVAEIMSSKPEDRRVIFEEATGISKFKSRKDENERKLERTRENLTQFALIMSEVEDRLGPLERQANKTREYNELISNLRHHELNTYMSKSDSVVEDKAKINNRINALIEEASVRNDDFKANEDRYNAVMIESDSLNKVISNLNHEYTELRVQAEKKSSQNALHNTRVNFFEQQVKSEQDKLDSNVAKILSNKKAIEDAKNTITEKKKQRAISGNEELRVSSEIIKITELINLGESLERESNKKIISSIESLSEKKVLKGTADTELSNYTERRQEQTKKLNDLNTKKEEVLSALDLTEKSIVKYNNLAISLKEDIASKENEVRSLNDEIAKADNDIYKLNSYVSTLKTKEDFYRSYKDNYSGYNESIQNLFKHAKTNPTLKGKIKGVVAELISADKKFDVALETALGASAQNIVTETPEDAKYLIEYLKSHSLGRLTFLPKTSVKGREIRKEILSAVNEVGALGEATSVVKYDSQYENVISGLLANTLICDNIDNATKIAKKYSFAFKIVTIDGDVIATQGSMTGGSRKSNQAGVLSNDRKLEDVINELKSANSKMDATDKQKKSLEATRDKALDELEELNKKQQDTKQNNLLEGQKKKALEGSLLDYEKEILAVTEVLEFIDNKIDELNRRLLTVSGDSEALEEHRKTLSNEAEKNSVEAETLKTKKDNLNKELTDIRVNLTDLTNAIDALDESITSMSNENVSLKEENDRLEESIESKKTIIEEIRLEMQVMAMTEEERAELDRVKNKIDENEAHRDDLRAEVDVLTQKRQEIQDEITALIDKRHIQENALVKIDADLEYLQQSVWEDYQETYESAQKDREENYDVKAGEEEIKRLRTRKNFLGNINANAIEELKELQDRYEDMKLQKEDLEKAEADIKEALDTIKGEMVTQFDEGFKKINENFGKIFKELFGGGSAALELDYSNATDKLDAGVEIKIQPPGKKFQKLSLYSGGEQALTAIAILFSILRLNPMAFCVLDEIEAALDEANVDRFATYLKKFSKDTQFIVITHRKPTMEQADSLFGVTMEEKGVSKLVSVKLSDVKTEEA